MLSGESVGHEKKTLGASERKEEARVAWREQLKQLDAKQLVVIDECGSNVDLTPLYARAPKGLVPTAVFQQSQGKYYLDSCSRLVRDSRVDDH